MLTEEQKEYIIKELDKKGIGVQIQDYVLHYCEVNAKLYAHVIPIQDIIKRVIQNLDDDIKYHAKYRSEWNSKEKTIRISWKRHGKVKEYSIFHELDHVATSSKDNLKQANKGKSFSYLVSGIDAKISLNGGKEIDFEYLDEGITDYKVMKYIMYETSNTTNTEIYKLSKHEYLPYINVVSQLVDIVGEDIVIRDQFYGDIVDLEERFAEKVQEKYNLFEIVDDMNKSVFLDDSNFFHPIRTIKAKRNLKQKLEISKKIAQCTNLGIELSKEEMNVKDLNDILTSHRKRTKEHQKIDFIPKVIIKGTPMIPREENKGARSLER